MIYITIHEGEFEDIELSKYIDKLKYFDSIKKRLLLGEEVHYRDYLITYKKPRTTAAKHIYGLYDYNDDFVGYFNQRELANYFNVTKDGVKHAIKRGYGYGFRIESETYTKMDKEAFEEHMAIHRKKAEGNTIKEWYNQSTVTGLKK